MNATRDPSLYTPIIAATYPVAASGKPLWAAVGVLSIFVLSMGASLVHVNKRAAPAAQAAIPLASGDAMNSLAASNGMITEEKLPQKALKTPANTAQSAPKKIAANTAFSASPAAAAQTPNAPQPAPSASPAPAVGQAPAAAVCNTCGTIEAVTPVTKEAQGSGVGVIAGGVLGGVVGNQIGKGNGKTATTILGALGGGWAGNAIEKNMKKTTAYSVRIRMEDGSRRTIEQSTAPMVGSKVTLDGKAIRPA